MLFLHLGGGGCQVIGGVVLGGLSTGPLLLLGSKRRYKRFLGVYQAGSKGSRDAHLKGCLLYSAIAALVGKSLALVNLLAVLNWGLVGEVDKCSRKDVFRPDNRPSSPSSTAPGQKTVGCTINSLTELSCLATTSGLHYLKTNKIQSIITTCIETRIPG